MSHHTAYICVTHKIVQMQCRCPEPITFVIEEECKHSFPITDQKLFWNGEKIVWGYQDEAVYEAALDAEIERLHGPGAVEAINNSIASGEIYGTPRLTPEQAIDELRRSLGAWKTSADISGTEHTMLDILRHHVDAIEWVVDNQRRYEQSKLARTTPTYVLSHHDALMAHVRQEDTAFGQRKDPTR